MVLPAATTRRSCTGPSSADASTLRGLTHERATPSAGQSSADEQLRHAAGRAGARRGRRTSGTPTASEYLDLLGGIAVNALGHAHPASSRRSPRSATLGHVSNLSCTTRRSSWPSGCSALAGRPGRVFFCNSGAEANEAAFKISRLTGRTKIVAAEGAFHGRTMGALALTGQPPSRAPFAPLPGDVDARALRRRASAATPRSTPTPRWCSSSRSWARAASSPAPTGYLAAAPATRDAAGALLVLDEVQTGIGRTGHWFAHQARRARARPGHAGQGPRRRAADRRVLGFGAAGELLEPGQHGTTFGGNPVCRGRRARGAATPSTTRACSSAQARSSGECIAGRRGPGPPAGQRGARRGLLLGDRR